MNETLSKAMFLHGKASLLFHLVFFVSLILAALFLKNTGLGFGYLLVATLVLWVLSLGITITIEKWRGW